VLPASPPLSPQRPRLATADPHCPADADGAAGDGGRHDVPPARPAPPADDIDAWAGLAANLGGNGGGGGAQSASLEDPPDQPTASLGGFPAVCIGTEAAAGRKGGGLCVRTGAVRR